MINLNFKIWSQVWFQQSDQTLEFKNAEHAIEN